jgi:hypothetical protein
MSSIYSNKGLISSCEKCTTDISPGMIYPVLCTINVCMRMGICYLVIIILFGWGEGEI